MHCSFVETHPFRSQESTESDRFVDHWLLAQRNRYPLYNWNKYTNNYENRFSHVILPHAARLVHLNLSEIQCILHPVKLAFNANVFKCLRSLKLGTTYWNLRLHRRRTHCGWSYWIILLFKPSQPWLLHCNFSTSVDIVPRNRRSELFQILCSNMVELRKLNCMLPQHSVPTVIIQTLKSLKHLNRLRLLACYNLLPCDEVPYDSDATVIRANIKSKFLPLLKQQCSRTCQSGVSHVSCSIGLTYPARSFPLASWLLFFCVNFDFVFMYLCLGYVPVVWSLCFA